MRKQGLGLHFDSNTDLPKLVNGYQPTIVEVQTLPELLHEAINLGL